MLADHDVVSGKIRAAIPFVVRGITDEDTPGGMKSKLMQGCHRHVGGSRHTQRPKDARR
jgi:hypothetical protein